jgi:hypothetical protein
MMDYRLLANGVSIGEAVKHSITVTLLETLFAAINI